MGCALPGHVPARQREALPAVHAPVSFAPCGGVCPGGCVGRVARESCLERDVAAGHVLVRIEGRRECLGSRGDAATCVESCSDMAGEIRHGRDVDSAPVAVWVQRTAFGLAQTRARAAGIRGRGVLRVGFAHTVRCHSSDCTRCVASGPFLSSV